jgi:hypothetical protein
MIEYRSTSAPGYPIDFRKRRRRNGHLLFTIGSNALSEGFHRSRRLGGQILSLIGLLLATSASLASGRDSKPRIVIPQTSYDFGDIFAGQYMYHVFPMRNEGTLPLTMSDELPGKPGVKPSPPASPATGAYTYPGQRTHAPLDVLTLGEAFGVRPYPACRLGAAFVAGRARVAARDTTGETSLASATTASFAANPFVSGELVPT